MWGLKSWEDSQISGLGGDATKQGTGRRGGLRAGGYFRVSNTELNGTLLKTCLREREKWAEDGILGDTEYQGEGDNERASLERNQEHVVMS